ncbi:HAD family hydrolase [Lentzea sp. NEAU-D7]|uniref:HAD family hydrolase n=1 Tax=Lentzea sp. NEAU-D7 TaxID=2994667 RepID=UPI00224A81DA|nr:HAD family hydrolase [Lentzea sp. NEAU-D7]MCX2952791.1 HAD family hydrolase [Lentzea sp. NEAU-D7]
MTGTRLAVFDLDGTLVDSPRAIVATFTEVLALLGSPARQPEAIRATIGMPMEKAFGTLLGVAADDPLVASGVEHYQQVFRKLVLPRARELVFPGVADGLAELADAGVALAVATSKFRRSADALLDAAGLAGLFELVVGADEVRNPKPHPEIGEKILHALDVPAARAVMVGDTTHDVLMAHATGMRAIAVTYGVHDRAELATARPHRYADAFPEVVVMVRTTAQEEAVL